MVDSAQLNESKVVGSRILRIWMSKKPDWVVGYYVQRG